MNFNIKANLLGGQFSISHTLDNPDFNSALIATELLNNLKDHKLYGRVVIKGYDTSVDANLLSGLVETSGRGDEWVYCFTGIIITVHLPDEYNLSGDVRGMNKRLHMYNCFLENFIQHMHACKMPAFFQYDVVRDVTYPTFSAHATIMIPTFDSADGAFFDITKFSALEGIVTNVPQFDPLEKYEETDTILKIPNGFHLERISLSPYTTNQDEADEWYVIVRNTPNS